MSWDFLHPGRLWLLLGVALLALAIVAGSVQRRRRAVKFTNIDLLDSIVPARPAWRRHVVSGLVTGPVHKAAINEGGIAYSGTTELLAQQAGCDVVMMLANDIVRVALVTTHLPLRAVPDAITAGAIERCLRITDAALRRDFGLVQPRIAVLGLNPHAGEAGHLGREEIEAIKPAIEAARARGMKVSGPVPADSVFHMARIGRYDAVLSLYHDQGHIAAKMMDFEKTVSVTLGLPILRTSVDHGTAFDIAGTGKASAVTSRPMPSSGVNQGPRNQISRAVAAQPPRKPSQVLLGLILGMILRRPSALPKTYWATSLNSVASSRNSARPAGPAAPASVTGVRITKAT